MKNHRREGMCIHVQFYLQYAYISIYFFFCKMQMCMQLYLYIYIIGDQYRRVAYIAGITTKAFGRCTFSSFPGGVAAEEILAGRCNNEACCRMRWGISSCVLCLSFSILPCAPACFVLLWLYSDWSLLSSLVCMVVAEQLLGRRLQLLWHYHIGLFGLVLLSIC